MDLKDIKISKRFFIASFFPCLPICPSKMCLEMARHFFLVLPIIDFGSGPKCAYQDPKAAMGSTKMCLEHPSPIFFEEKKMDQAKCRRVKKKQTILLYYLQ
jgi:hypothetical protein